MLRVNYGPPKVSRRRDRRTHQGRGETPLSTSSTILTERAVVRAYSRWETALQIGRRIRWARESAGLSQQELGVFVGISPRTLHRIEQGERTLTGRERAAIARGLGVSIGS